MNIRLNQLLRSVLPLFALVFISPHANAQFGSDFIESHSVRVIAKYAGKAKAASGFLWKNSTQVVTSLHAIPAGSQITVECRGVSRTASVSEMLVKADLILLNVSGLPSSCRPFTEFDEKKPERNTPLWTFGYHAGAKSLTDREFKKRFGSPERLDYLVTGKPLQEIIKLGYPDPKLDIYYVQGGLLPGYSGGPVVDKDGNLIGIVDGGLNKGASSYNWVIPAKYLDELVPATARDIPRSNSENSSTAFASGIAVTDESSVFEYPQGDSTSSWVLTKTQSLYDLAETADDLEGVQQLYDFFAQSAGVSDPSQLVFDIYEEQELELIIAVPSGQGLQFGDDGSGEDRLHSLGRSSSDAGGQISFLVAEGSAKNNLGVEITPNDEGYFQHYIAGALAKCQDPLINVCQLDPDLTRKIDFGDDNIILRFAILEFDFSTGKTFKFHYYTLATSGEFTFEAIASFSTQGDSGLIQCASSEDDQGCGNSALAKEQLMQVLAVHLTSFPETQTGEDQRPAQTEITIDTQYDDPSTMLVPYFDGEDLSFFNDRGKLWRVFTEEDTYEAVEVSREDGFVTVRYLEEFYYTLPVEGGIYVEWSDDSEPETAGELRKITPSDLTPYFEGESGGAYLKFLNTGGKYWSIYGADGDYLETSEVRRESNPEGVESALLEFDDVDYLVPIGGGQYYEYKLENPEAGWVSGGTVQIYAE